MPRRLRPDVRTCGRPRGDRRTGGDSGRRGPGRPGSGSRRRGGPRRPAHARGAAVPCTSRARRSPIWSAASTGSPSASTGWTPSSRSSTSGPATWPTTEVALAARQAELDRLEADRRHVLEQAAGLTAEQARAELVEAIEHEAKRDAALLVRDIERTAQRRGRAAGPARSSSARSSGWPPSRPRESRRLGAAPARRRHEGPDHRPRGPQHPGLRAGHRRQPDHRRHPGGGAAVLLRPGPPRGRPAHPGGAGRSTAGSTRSASRRSTTSAQRRGRARCACGPARTPLVEVGITDLHPELVDAARPAALPHVLRAERAQAPRRVRPHRRADGRRARPGPGRCVQRCAFLHDIGKALTHEVEGSHALVGADAGPQVRRARGRRARDRGAPQRGRAAHRRGGAHPGRRRDQRRPAGRPAGVAGGLRRAAGAARGDRARARRAWRRSSRCRPAARSG